MNVLQKTIICLGNKLFIHSENPQVSFEGCNMRLGEVWCLVIEVSQNGGKYRKRSQRLRIKGSTVVS